MQLLLIEDHLADARLLQEMLYRAWGKPVAYTHATTLATALDRLSQSSYEVIITDLGLPDSEGLETFYAVQEAAPTTPILVLSGLADTSVAMAAVRGRAQDYLPKDDLNSTLLMRSIQYAIERKRVESELIQARAEAEKMSRLKSSFLANLSHEIRTPLTSILGYASLLAHELDGPFREWATTISQSGDRLLRTINSVLDLALLESGNLELSRNVVDLGRVVDDQLQLITPWAAEKNLTVIYNAPEPACTVYGDRICLDRVVANLLENAIKFTPSGTITITLNMLGGQACLSIEDTGIGMSPSFLKEIFNAFQQESVGEARDYEGIGLGLTVAKRLLNLHGGSIHIESHKGVGSRFSCMLPLHQPNVDALAPTTVKTEINRRPKLLIVDDHRETLVLLETILHRKYDVHVAASSETALHKTKHHTFDLLLLDMQLEKEMSGLDLLQQIRQQPHHHAVRSISITVHTQPSDRDTYLKGGFNYFLSKPFTTVQLLQAIDRTLHQGVRSTG